MPSPTSDVLHQDVSEPDPPNQEPTPSTSAAPTPVIAKEEPEKTQHLPPAGSVDNPMEIDDSDDDETVPRGSAATPKRKMKGPCILDNLLACAELYILVPPPSGETPGKRRKPTSNLPSGSKNPAPPTTSQTHAVSAEAAESPKKPVCSLTGHFEG